MNTLQTKWGDPSGKCGVVSHCSTQVWGRAYVWRRSRDQQVQRKKTLFKSNSFFYLIRTLERCLKESRCLDLESLCIISEEKVFFTHILYGSWLWHQLIVLLIIYFQWQVWTVRLDLHVICHEGSLADACSVAGLAALSHFRRPDVTLKVVFLNRKHHFRDPNSFSPAAGRLSNCAPHSWEGPSSSGSASPPCNNHLCHVSGLVFFFSSSDISDLIFRWLEALKPWPCASQGD